MTNDQRNLLTAARLDLLNQAMRYTVQIEHGTDNLSSEHRLLTSAMTFASVVNSIDPKLWEWFEPTS